MLLCFYKYYHLDSLGTDFYFQLLPFHLLQGQKIQLHLWCIIKKNTMLSLVTVLVLFGYVLYGTEDIRLF